MQKLKTDKWEIYIDEGNQVVKFYNLQIKMGEIVRCQHPKFSVRKRDFHLYQPQLKQLLAYLQTWTSPP